MFLEDAVAVEVVVEEVREEVGVDKVHVRSAHIVGFLVTSRRNVGTLWANLSIMFILHPPLIHQVVPQLQRTIFSQFLKLNMHNSYNISQLSGHQVQHS